jgi:hypothetical protein
MTVEEACDRWLENFLWVHPNLGWYSLPPAELDARVRRVVRAAGPSRYCLMISEDVPPSWERTVPRVLTGGIGVTHQRVGVNRQYFPVPP